MRRLLVLSCAVAFCAMLSGCTSDPQGDAIGAVEARMNDAANDIKNIADEVDKAVKKYDKDKGPLDLTEAGKMAEKLKETAKKAQDIRVTQIEHIKVTDGEKTELEQRFKTRINNAFSALVTAKTELNTALQKAETIDREKTDELRTKIREAEGPFETLARQG
jgi:hypothetical protein